MKPAKTISPQYWMTTPQTQAVLKALGGQARFVGGCVRNALLGADVEDIDIATPLTPPEVIKVLESAGLKAVPTGVDFGTVTAVSDGKGYEITTLRKDIETDGRRAVVAYTKDWAEDAQRRDFTMNTLLADDEGHIYDPVQRGLKDLEERRVIFVGDPAARIGEDYLRILRFFRFHALYGKGAPDKKALKACSEAAANISKLSAERVTQEFFKILSCDRPSEILDLMFKNDVLKEFQFKEYNADFMRVFCEFQIRYGLGFLAARLLVLSGFDKKNFDVLDKTLLIPKVFKKDIEAISKILALPDLTSDQAVRVAVYKHGRVTAAQALIIELAQDRVMHGQAPRALDIIQNWDIPNFPVSGHDLMAQGMEPGEEMGKALEKLEEEWIARGFKDS